MVPFNLKQRLLSCKTRSHYSDKPKKDDAKHLKTDLRNKCELIFNSKENSPNVKADPTNTVGDTNKLRIKVVVTAKAVVVETGPP